MLPSRLSFRASLGSVVDGSLDGSAEHDIGPGIVGAANVAKQFVSSAWFVTPSLTIGASRITTRTAEPGASKVSLVATDFRVGVMAGRAVGPVSPYVLARAFAGPVSWTLDGMDVVGTDTHHYQLGAGASFATESGFAISLDISALGERAASLGMAFRL